MVLVTMFITALVMANVLAASKIITINFGLFSLSQAVGILAYPITFLATDLISELFGEDVAKKTVYSGLAASIILLLLVEVGRSFPSLLTGQDATYSAYFQSTFRAIFASMLAYLIAQLIDLRLFHFWKKFTNGKHLWLRNNGSTIGSQVIDTVVVTSILFWGTPVPDVPGASMGVDEIMPLIRDGAIFKGIVALLDTPLFYLGVFILGRYVRPRGGLDKPA